MYKSRQTRMYRHSGNFVLGILVAFLVVLLGACGNGEGAGSDSQTPPGASPEPTPEPTGTLRVELNHLPESVAAEVSFSGADEGTMLVSESHEFTDLPAGTYTVQASPADTWFVTGDRSVSVEVKAGDTASASFTYEQAFDFSGAVAYFDDNDEHWFGWTEMPVVNFASEREKHPNVADVAVQLEFPNGWSFDGFVPPNWDYAGPGEVQLEITTIPAVPQGTMNVIATFSTTVADQHVSQELVVPVEVKAVVFETDDDPDTAGTLRWLLTGERTVGVEITFDPQQFDAASPELLLGEEIIIEHDVTITGFEGTQGLITIRPETANPNHRLFVVAEDAAVELTSLAFVGAQVDDDDHGGAIFVEGFLALNNSLLRGNRADNGGAIAAVAEAEVSIHNTEFVNNVAKTFGGAIFADGASVIISGESVATENKAGWSGGAFYARESSIEIANSHVLENKAERHGGAILAWDSTITITEKSIVSQNEAEWNGGAIYAHNDSSVEIADSSVSNNTAGQQGGAILAAFSSVNITEKSIVMANNAAEDGGAIYAPDWSTLTISGESVVSENEAGIRGGAIYARVKTSVTIMEKSLVSENIASESGGAIRAEDAHVEIVDSTISNNTATLHGGAISARFSSVLIAGATVSNNGAMQDGGAVHAIVQSPTEIADSTVSHNKAERDGGAVFAGDSPIEITDSEVSNNTADQNGGAIHLVGTAMVEHIRTAFDNNVPDDYP